MKHLLQYLGTPTTLVVAFFLVGAPSAPGVTAIETLVGVSVGVGGCAVAAPEGLVGPLPPFGHPCIALLPPRFRWT